jgi:hypothetical protein
MCGIEGPRVGAIVSRRCNDRISDASPLAEQESSPQNRHANAPPSISGVLACRASTTPGDLLFSLHANPRPDHCAGPSLSTTLGAATDRPHVPGHRAGFMGTGACGRGFGILAHICACRNPGTPSASLSAGGVGSPAHHLRGNVHGVPLWAHGNARPSQQRFCGSGIAARTHAPAYRVTLQAAHFV